MAERSIRNVPPLWNAEHLEIVKQGCASIFNWRKKNPHGKFELMYADLKGANLHLADLSDSNLMFADLSHADLSEADLAYCDLSYAALNEANLWAANLSYSKLNLTQLKNANCNGCVIAATLFIDVDLSEACDLEFTDHQAPSTIGIDTLYRSNGKIPEEFLRGCGVPEDFITCIPSLVGTVIEFYSSFISHSSKDDEFAKRLHSKMQQEKLRVWYAPEDMKGGRKSHHQIEESIRVYDKLLLVLSEESMNSEWVKTELRWASREEKRTGKQKLFPIRLVSFDTIRKWECFDAEIGKDLAVEVREYNIPNFTNWKDHESFEAEFKKLLRDLKGDSPSKLVGGS